MRTYCGTDVLAIADELAELHGDVFTAPPWSADLAVSKEFRERLETDAHRPGFRAVVAEGAHGIDGFGTGWITQRPFPTGRSYCRSAVQLGAWRVEDLLVGAFEVDELAVRRQARHRGVGRRLLAELVHDAPAGRAWLLTARRIFETMEFYRRTGWYEVPPLPGAGNEIVVFLAPAHPAAR